METLELVGKVLAGVGVILMLLGLLQVLELGTVDIPEGANEEMLDEISRRYQKKSEYVERTSDILMWIGSPLGFVGGALWLHARAEKRKATPDTSERD